MHARKPIAVTMGDAAGIGPEIVVRALRTLPAGDAFAIADVDVMRRALGFLRGAADMPESPLVVIESSADAAAVPAGSIAVLPMQSAIAGLASLPIGRVHAACGAAAAACVRQAVALARAGEVAAIVTAPLHKEALAAAGEPYPGHTELLAAECAQPGHALPVRMMLANDELRTVLVSVHLSLREAVAAVTFDRVLETIRIAHAGASSFLGRPPRMAVAGLNPHAGEGGLFGDEEQRIIGPAVAAARGEGIDAHGPLPPDTVFMRARRRTAQPGEFDLVIAMHHDQGLIPVKYLGLEQGVNVTLGLPIVRTSPDHGTAFDLAGTGRASAQSLEAALRMARDLALPLSAAGARRSVA
jgi:4-hydroxythreonine-4-phosphate dehydrogenase